MFRNKFKEKLNYLNFRICSAEKIVEDDMNEILNMPFDEFRQDDSKIKLNQLIGMQVVINYVKKWLEDNPKDYIEK